MHFLVFSPAFSIHIIEGTGLLSIHSGGGTGHLSFHITEGTGPLFVTLLVVRERSGGFHTEEGTGHYWCSADNEGRFSDLGTNSYHFSRIAPKKVTFLDCWLPFSEMV